MKFRYYHWIHLLDKFGFWRSSFRKFTLFCGPLHGRSEGGLQGRTVQSFIIFAPGPDLNVLTFGPLNESQMNNFRPKIALLGPKWAILRPCQISNLFIDFVSSAYLWVKFSFCMAFKRNWPMWAGAPLRYGSGDLHPPPPCFWNFWFGNFECCPSRCFGPLYLHPSVISHDKPCHTKVIFTL